MFKQKIFFLAAGSAMFVAFYSINSSFSARIPASVDLQSNAQMIPQSYSVNDINVVYESTIYNETQLRQNELAIQNALVQSRAQRHQMAQNDPRQFSSMFNPTDTNIRKLDNDLRQVKLARQNNLYNGYMRLYLTAASIQVGLTSTQLEIIRKKLDYLAQLKTAAYFEGNPNYVYPTAQQPFITAAPYVPAVTTEAPQQQVVTETPVVAPAVNAPVSAPVAMVEQNTIITEQQQPSEVPLDPSMDGLVDPELSVAQ
jgi:hypothetical protein